MTISFIVGLVIIVAAVLFLVRSRNKASHHLDHLHISSDEHERKTAA